MKISNPSVSFSHFQPKYKCCCGTVHVKQGTLMISIVSLLMAIIGTAGVFVGHESRIMAAVEIFSIAIELVTIVLLYIGVKRENKMLLLPFLVYQLLSMICYFVILIGCIWAIFDTESPAGTYIRESTISEDEKELEHAMHKEGQENVMTSLAAAFVSVALLLTLLITAWFVTVTCRCYMYFADLEKARKENDQPVKYDASERV